jgi:hypothetical protein
MQLPDMAVRTPIAGPAETAPAPAGEPEPPPLALSRWSRSLLGAISLLILTLTAAQLVSMFLEAAPRNTVSQRYRAQLSWWVEPWLEQDWRLFAPDPQTSNLTIRARARRADGTATAWVDLTAADYAAIAHDPMPSQANQNELRRAWSAYLATVSTPGNADTANARLLKQYLANIAAQRLAGSVAGPVTSVQLQARGTPIALPGTAASTPPKEVSTPWLTP